MLAEQLNRALRSGALNSSTLFVTAVLYLMWTLDYQASFECGNRWLLFKGHVKGAMRMTTCLFAMLTVGITTHGWAGSRAHESLLVRDAVAGQLLVRCHVVPAEPEVRLDSVERSRWRTCRRFGS